LGRPFATRSSQPRRSNMNLKTPLAGEIVREIAEEAQSILRRLVE
jgi:hypothetical protein